MVGSEQNRLFFDWIGSAIARAVSCKCFSPVGNCNFTLYQRLSFLFTGFVMVFSLLVLAELQWDMARPSQYAALTPE